MAGNGALTKAKAAKYDEFYTQLSDIENELVHYTNDPDHQGTVAGNQFAGQHVYCNCDDPEWSNFYRYFVMNFHRLGLASLTTTHYDADKSTYKIEVNSADEAAYAMKAYEANEPLGSLHLATKLHGNGDFRNAESIELLERSDIVVTNPPFSLFREYIRQLVDYEKRFIVIGNMNAITYKEIFALIKANRIWLGKQSESKTMLFGVKPEYGQWLLDNKREETAYRIIDGVVMAKLRNACWFTNLTTDKRTDMPIPYQTYAEGLAKGMYPKYDNYDAIEVSRVADIPSDYDGVMGVPITFLYKWAPNIPISDIIEPRAESREPRAESVRNRRTIQNACRKYRCPDELHGHKWISAPVRRPIRIAMRRNVQAGL